MAQITSPVLLDSTGQDIAESLRVLVGRTPDTWEGVRIAINGDKAALALPVGTQIEDRWGAYTALWDVTHRDSSGNVYFKWHYTLPEAVQFDAPEAVYCAGSNGLAAGTYYISIGTAYGTGWDTAKHIQFTLTRAMVEGDQFVIDCGTNKDVDPTDGRTWSVYHAGGTTVLESGSTSNGTAGTELGTIGDTDINKTNGLLNALSRVVYGYGRWSQSAFRQYLNSTAPAGAWWSAQNGWDRPPAQSATLAGFLAGCSSEFLSVLQPVEVVTALSTEEGFSDTFETTRDRIFLPSLQEIYIVPQIAGIEGEEWDYCKLLAQEAGLAGRFQRGQSYPILKNYSISSVTSSVGIWLRSCFSTIASGVWYVNGGSHASNNACVEYRGCPACKLMKSTT